MKEYIMPIDDTAFDWDEMFVGVIRKQEELIRCKDCKYRDGQSANCTRFRKDWYVQGNSFCSWAERKDNERVDSSR